MIPVPLQCLGVAPAGSGGRRVLSAPESPADRPHHTRSPFLALCWGVAGLLAACGEAPEPPPSVPATAASRPATAVSDWPSHRGDPGLRGVASDALRGPLVPAWRHVTPGPITSSPVVCGDLVVVGSGDGSVYGLDRSTGTPRWAFATGEAVEAPPLVWEGRVFIGSSNGICFALDLASGRELWRRATEDKILAGAAALRLPDGSARILVGSYDCHLHGLDAATGEVVFRHETGNYINGTVALAGEQAIFGGCDAVLHLVSAKDGTSVRQVPLGGDRHVAGSVAVADGVAYFGHYAAEVLAVDLESGRILWTHEGRNEFFSSPAVGTDRLVIGGRDRHVHCLRRRDGELLWRFPTRRKVDGSPVIAGDLVVVGSGDGHLYGLRLSDGTEVFRYDLGASIPGSPAVCGSHVFVATEDGAVTALRDAGST